MSTPETCVGAKELLHLSVYNCKKKEHLKDANDNSQAVVAETNDRHEDLTTWLSSCSRN